MDRAVAGVTAFMCAAAILAASIGPFWRIRDVAIEGAHHVPVDAVVAASELLGAQSFSASAARARARLVKLPAVRDAQVQIRIPDHVTVILSERVAVARWISGGTEWFVDAEGVLFSSLDPRGAPDIRVTDEQKTRQAGDRLDPALVEAATKLARLGPADLRPDATSPRVVLAAGATGLVLRVAAGWEIRFGGAERIDDKIALARRFLRDNQQRKLDYVDVRSPDQIVFSPS
ncbi:MAG TPA: FtsQ-type POTRA domain-containing protein [Candidatus Limnocylindria bacterium]|jgi:cell division protein FtsQ